MSDIEVWREGDGYVAADDDALVHAFGTTEKEARVNLVRRRLDQRTHLANLGRDKLYPHLRKALDYLEQLQHE